MLLGGILWCGWLLLAVAELLPKQLCSQLAAGQRGWVALRTWTLVAQRLQMQVAAEEEQGSSWAAADRKALGCAVQGGLGDKAAVAQARKDPVPFLPLVVSQGLPPFQGLGVVIARPRWGWELEATNSHIAEVGAGASHSFWLCGDAKCFSLRRLLC